VRIASYNIRKAVGLDWKRDPDRIVDVLAELEADIVVLQEADRRIGARAGVLSLQRLEADLGLQLAEVSLRPQSHGWHGNVILAKRSLQLETGTRIELPHRDPRGAVSAIVSEPNLEIIGTHLGLTPRTRQRQMDLLANYILDSEIPTIIAGDFNEWNDARFPKLPGMTVVTPGPSYHASRPIGTLDRFIINGAIQVLGKHVHRSELALRASDHLPVVMDFERLGVS
jgi:endonuclease/exonuclease/phosphatase family metal-dependent hydrolase